MSNLNTILDRVIKYLDRSDAFLSDQVPEFCKQLMEYHAWGAQWSYDICFWLTLFFFTTSVVLILAGIIKDNGEHHALAACTGVCFIITFSITFHSYKNLRMYQIAPKVYLVKTVKDMMVKR